MVIFFEPRAVSLVVIVITDSVKQRPTGGQLLSRECTVLVTNQLMPAVMPRGAAGLSAA